jgi:dipeptidyl aminopeptidase/acylaminoacyl peptidase
MTLLKPRVWFAAGLSGLLLPGAVVAQGRLADYRHAERFLEENLPAQIYLAEVQPHWLGQGGRFWYLKNGPQGKQFIEVDANAGTQVPAFDQVRLAAALSAAAGRRYAAERLPFDSFELADAGRLLRFRIGDARWQCHLAQDSCEAQAPQTYPEVLSPDGKWAAFVREHNLYLRDTGNDEVVALTHDGLPEDDYATPWPWLELMVEQGVADGAAARQAPAVSWSPDSRRLLTYRMNTRAIGHLESLQFVPTDQLRPKAYRYVYPLPGEPLPTAQPVIFELGNAIRRIDVATTPLLVQSWGWGELAFDWAADNRHVRYAYLDRGSKFIELREVDAATGRQRVLQREETSDDTYVDPFATQWRGIDASGQFLWTSERSGRNQLYLHDDAGRLLRQLTRGQGIVREIVSVDAVHRQVYALIAGEEPGIDPYLTRLYRIGLDDGTMQRLTPEPANHRVAMSPDGRHFVDNYSRVDLPSVAVLRRSSDGAILRTLEHTDTRWLTQQGWQAPIPFQGKAADGRTNLYGLIVRPTHFDPARRYPVVEYAYTGPHNFFVPKTFAGTMELQATAELGFVVVMVDGRGTAKRSHDFHVFSYHNLGGVFADHVTMIRQMAQRYPWMDTSRVGIYGYSHGGYGSTRALLRFPDFYRVAVSTSGDHDARLDKAGWNELFQGYPAGRDYVEQTNESLVDKLKGHLLLIHGDLDGNVHPAETMRLVDALMRANKPFDMLLVPNMAHGDSGPHKRYVTLRRWNYLVQHLLDMTPPRDFYLPEPPPADAG